MRLAVTQISRPRADQLRYLVRMLELGAVDFDRRASALRTAPRAVVSTARVLPVPVGPRNSGFPTARPSEFNPGGTPGRGPPPPARLRSAPTIFCRSAASKFVDSSSAGSDQAVF